MGELTGLVLSFKNELLVQAITSDSIAKLASLWYNVYHDNGFVLH
jgi:hypothetical protein